MSASRLAQGLIKLAKLLSASRDSQIAASQTDAVVFQWVLPYQAMIHRADYSMTVAGSSGTVTALTLQVSGSSISEALAPAAGAGTKTGSWAITSPLGKVYPTGTVVKAIATTAANSTIDDGCATLVLQPVMG